MIDYKEFCQDKLGLWREFYTPSPDHPYYGIQTIDHLKVVPLRHRIAASRYLELALQGQNTVQNIRAVISFSLSALFAEELYKELTNGNV